MYRHQRERERERESERARERERGREGRRHREGERFWPFSPLFMALISIFWLNVGLNGSSRLQFPQPIGKLKIKVCLKRVIKCCSSIQVNLQSLKDPAVFFHLGAPDAFGFVARGRGRSWGHPWCELWHWCRRGSKCWSESIYTQSLDNICLMIFLSFGRSLF